MSGGPVIIFQETLYIFEQGSNVTGGVVEESNFCHRKSTDLLVATLEVRIPSKWAILVVTMRSKEWKLEWRVNNVCRKYLNNYSK